MDSINIVRQSTSIYIIYIRNSIASIDFNQLLVYEYWINTVGTPNPRKGGNKEVSNAIFAIKEANEARQRDERARSLTGLEV